MSRTLVDIPDDLLEELTVLARQADISRAELMRKGLRDYVDSVRRSERKAGKSAAEAVRGLWKKRNIDGVEYQRQLRAEWDGDQ